jgi:glycosyltransferase involved in cell wall biosynthesis
VPQPWLTVVTVVKDDSRGFQRTALSIQAQAVEAFEWIIVDGSSDQLTVPALLRSVPVTSRYLHQPPKGIYEAMNLGLELASGRYVYFLNGGDCLHTAAALRAVQSGLTSQPAWLYGQVAFVDPRGQSRVPVAFDYVRERQRLFAHGRFPPHQGTVIDTAVLREQGGFDTTYRVAADYALLLKMSQIADPVELDTVIADFFVGGLSTTSWTRSLADFHRARREVLQPSGAVAAREIVDTLIHGAKLAIHNWIAAPIASSTCGANK